MKIYFWLFILCLSIHNMTVQGAHCEYTLNNFRDQIDDLPACFIRTQYKPERFTYDLEFFLNLDLSEEKMNDCKVRLDYTKTLAVNNNTVDVKWRNELLMDYYCQLAKDGYPPIYWILTDVFREGQYGQKQNLVLSSIFLSYIDAVGTINKIKSAQVFAINRKKRMDAEKANLLDIMMKNDILEQRESETSRESLSSNGGTTETKSKINVDDHYAEAIQEASVVDPLLPSTLRYRRKKN